MRRIVWYILLTHNIRSIPRHKCKRVNGLVSSLVYKIKCILHVTMRIQYTTCDLNRYNIVGMNVCLQPIVEIRLQRGRDAVGIVFRVYVDAYYVLCRYSTYIIRVHRIYICMSMRLYIVWAVLLVLINQKLTKHLLFSNHYTLYTKLTI